MWLAKRLVDWVRSHSAVFSRMLGVLLLVSAGLKFYGLNAIVSNDLSHSSSGSWLQAVTILWEVFLGGSLLIGRNQFVVWCASVMTFGVFWAFSGYLGLIGRATCGCFGVVEASPWVAFTVDSLAIVTLLVIRPKPTTLRGRWAILTAATAVCIALLGILGTVWYGSVGVALTHLRGEQYAISPDVLDLGGGYPGDALTARVVVHNFSDRDTLLVGGTSDCSCVATNDLPLKIPAGGSASVSIKVTLPRATTPGVSSKVVAFQTSDYTRDPLFLRVNFTVYP